MTKRIFHSICLAALLVFLASMILVLGMLYGYFSRVQRNQLHSETALAAQGAQTQGLSFFEGLELPYERITWISPDGTVLYDTRADSGRMENHLQREEIQEALASGWGESSRWSVTLMERSLYTARRLEDGSVLRLSTAQSTILTLILGMSQPIATVFLLSILLSVLLARQLSRRIVKPFNELNLDEPGEEPVYEELEPMLRRIRSQQNQLRQQEQRLRQQQQELNAVTGSMREGMVLLNSTGTVLSINPAACALLHASPSCTGEDFLTVSPSPELHALLNRALEGTPAEATIRLGSGRYLAAVSPVLSEGAVCGAALLLFDVTEKEKSEQLRREFTANVSHELRTPLHAISGGAELLKSGLVKPEDVASFGAGIYEEAQRMIRLVEDIITLSHLDEGAQDLRREPTDLYALARTAVTSLTPKAKAAGVTLELKGAPAPLEAVPHLLSAILTNLCDNAIKYNRPGGRVTVEVTGTRTQLQLTVSDTGIGIPPEHQEHVFERFYRVDKSRSRAAGGTGLGLSIVRHAVLVLGGTIHLQSVPGQGTCITVLLPRLPESGEESQT